MAQLVSGVDEKVKAVQEALRRAREAQQAGGAEGVASALSELRAARATLADEPQGGTPDDDRQVEAAAAVDAEIALLYQNMRDMRAALEHFERAERLLRLLPLDAAGGRHRLQLATTLINQAGFLSSQNLVEESLSKGRDAVELLDAVEGPQRDTADLLIVLARHNQSTVLMATRRLEEAESALAQAWELGQRLADGPMPQVLPQVIDVAGRYTTVLKAKKMNEEAIAVARAAATRAEAEYLKRTPVSVRMYVATQLQMVDCHFALGAYSEAENHVWNAVDTTDDGQAMVIGSGFFLSLLRKDEQELEEGGLPREEVVEGLGEMLERIEAMNPPAPLREILRARESVMVTGDLDRGRAVVALLESSPTSSKDPATVQLLPLLKSDIAWRTTRLN